MKDFSIDINCDVGEGLGNEAQLLPLISSCNIACGGHAGNTDTIKEVAVLAKHHKVKIGAHPSYPDKENFGRVSMVIPENDLIASIKEQVENFLNVLKKEDITMHHIKPHGALYNDIAKDLFLARTFLKAIEPYKRCYLYVPYGSAIEKEALEHGFKIKREAFADRNYNTDLSLVLRKLPHAVLETPKLVLAHIISMVKENQLTTLNKEVIHIAAETYCVHGDTSTAVQILTYLSKELGNQNIKIARE